MVRDFSRIDLLGGLIWFFLGVGLSIGSIKLKLGNFYNPGAGLFPFLSGTLMGLLGLLLILLTILKGLGKEEVKSETFWLKENWENFLTALLTILTMVGYIILFRPLGFIPTTFLFLFFLFKLKEPKRWVIPMILSGVVVVLSYLLFSVWLRCQFPKGILNF
jgi:putative tricarboxylic transport membrane protein